MGSSERGRACEYDDSPYLTVIGLNRSCDSLIVELYQYSVLLKKSLIAASHRGALARRRLANLQIRIWSKWLRSVDIIAAIYLKCLTPISQ
jgi:hypothetical protein